MYIRRKVSVPHTKLTIMSGSLMPCLEICMTFYNAFHLHLTFLSDHFKGLTISTNLRFPPFFNSPVWRWPTEIVVCVLFRCTRLISIAFASNRNLPCTWWSRRIYVSFVIPLSPPIFRRRVQTKHAKCEYMYIISKTPTVNPTLTSVKTIDCQPLALKNNWNLHQNNVHSPVRRWALPSDLFCTFFC